MTEGTSPLTNNFGERPDKVVIISGAPRTGTHMVNAIVCTSKTVQPLLTEASAFIAMIERCRGIMKRSLKVHPGNYFTDTDEIDRLSAKMLDQFTYYLFRRYKEKIVVLRGPMISRFGDLLTNVIPYCRPDYRFILLVRDPRDIFCSLKVWNDKRIKRTGTPLAEDLMTFLVDTVNESYELLRNPALNRDWISVWRYEDVVTKPHRFVEFAGAWLDIRCDLQEIEDGWCNIKADLSPDNAAVSDAITPLYNARLSVVSVGRHKTELTPEERGEIELRLGDFMKQQGYLQ